MGAPWFPGRPGRPTANDWTRWPRASQACSKEWRGSARPPNGWPKPSGPCRRLPGDDGVRMTRCVGPRRPTEGRSPHARPEKHHRPDQVPDPARQAASVCERVCLLMSDLIAAWALPAVATYLLTGAIGLACVTFSSGTPRPLRDATPGGFGPVFRAGLKASATWPWTWKRWTDG